MLKKFLNKDIRKNFGNFFFFFGSSAVHLVVSLYTSPIFARNLSSWDYSAIGYFTSFQTFFVPLFNLAFYSYYMTNYFKLDESARKNLLMNLVFFLMIFNLLSISIALGILYAYFELSDVQFPLLPYSLFILGSAYFLFFKNFYLLDLKMAKRAKRYFFFNTFSVLFTIGLALLLVVHFQLGAKGKLGATLIANTTVGTIGFIFFFSKFKFDFNIIKSAIKFCYPLVFSAFLQFPVGNIDKIFLEKYISIEEFGLYNIGMAMAGYILTMSMALFQAFEPDFYEHIINKNKKKLIEIFIAFIIILSIPTIGFVLTSKYIVGYLTSYRYTDAYKFANIHIFANLLFVIYQIFVAAIIALKLTKVVFINKVIMAVISLIIYYFFISHWGGMGAALGKTLIYFIICSFSVFILLNRKRFAARFLKA